MARSEHDHETAPRHGAGLDRIRGDDPVGRAVARTSEVARLRPFAFAAVAALASVVLPPSQPETAELVAAAVLTVVVALAAAFVPAANPPRWSEAAAPLAYFVVIVLLRHAEGGAASGYGTLVLLPVFWLALHGTRPQLVASFVGVAATFVVPLLAFGAPEYPDSEWRRVVLWLIIAPVVGLTTQRLVEQVRGSARIDVLTGLLNRRAWDEVVDAALARSRRSREPVSLAIMDIDYFKEYNDRYGHHGGDLLLTDAAQTWRAALREVDVLARWGGEEFAVLLPGVGEIEARVIVERLRAATPAGVTCSAGLAEWNGRERSAELAKRADGALYEAKQSGRDRTILALPVPHPIDP